MVMEKQSPSYAGSLLRDLHLSVVPSISPLISERLSIAPQPSHTNQASTIMELSFSVTWSDGRKDLDNGQTQAPEGLATLLSSGS